MSSYRPNSVPVLGHTDHVAAECVIHGACAGEGGVWDVLPGCSALFVLLVAFSHRVLPLGKGLQNFLQVSDTGFYVLSVKAYHVFALPSVSAVYFYAPRLDYSGIALLIMGSFVPWLYYSFYCSPQPRLIYLSVVCVLGVAAIIVAQVDRFATPRHRSTRAGNALICSSKCSTFMFDWRC